jgi:hypothetical protein
MKTVQGPNGRLYLDHAPEKVFLIGMGPSIQDVLADMLTQELRDDAFDEVWAINMVGNTLGVDVCFWMDDLVQQRDHMPHKLVPTKGIKATISQVGQTLADACGEEVGRWAQGILAVGDEIPYEVYNDIVEDMKTLINKGALKNCPNEIMMMLGAAYAADAQNAKPDPSRTLAPLIRMLDKISHRRNIAVMTPTAYPEVVRNSLAFPIDEIGQLSYDIFGKPYLNNGVAMAIAYATWKGVKKLKIYGADFTYPNRDFAEGGRACVESWMTAASDRGVEVIPSKHTSLFDMVAEGAIYGYAVQPTLTMSDGKVFKYDPTKKPDRFGGQFIYKPENSSGKEPNNVLSVAAQADSASGPRNANDLKSGNGMGYSPNLAWAAPPQKPNLTHIAQDAINQSR